MPIDPAQGFPPTPVEYTETAGGPREQSNALIAAVDDAMRVAYDLHIQRVGLNVFPLLYSEATLDGGRYTLQVDAATTLTRAPVPALYQQLKSISHVPLGIFVRISEYARAPQFGQWLQPLQDFTEVLKTARIHLADAGMTQEEYQHNARILDASIQFALDALKSRTFTLDAFSQYTHAIVPDIVFNQRRAADVQVRAMTEVLLEWRQLLGEERWDRMYVVCSALWTLSVENVHELIIGHHMKPEHRETHLIVSEAVPTLAAARTLVGRIVSDRVMAERVFSTQTRWEREDIYSLSTRRDLISQAAEEVLGSADLAAMCPHAARAAKASGG